MGIINDRDNPTYRRLSAGVEDIDAPEVEKPSAAALWGAAFRTENVIGSFAARESGIYDNEIDPEFNALSEENLEGFEQYSNRFVNVFNERQNSALKRQISRELEDRKIIHRSGLSGFGAAMAAGTVDPTVLVPIGGTIKKGESLLRIGYKMAYAGAAGAAISESLLHGTQETRTLEESGFAIAGGTVLGGILGTGAVAGFRGVTGKPIAGFDPDTIAKFEREMIHDPDGTLNTSDPDLLAKIEQDIAGVGVYAPEVVQAHAATMEAMVTTLARRTGKDPSEFYAANGPALRDGGIDLGDDALKQASRAGYTGQDAGEATEWLQASRKGLDMSQDARMSRAREMGFDTDTVLYHGTGRDIDAFALPETTGERGGGARGRGDGGIWFTSKPEIAEDYANVAAKRQSRRDRSLAYHEEMADISRRRAAGELTVEEMAIEQTNVEVKYGGLPLLDESGSNVISAYVRLKNPLVIPANRFRPVNAEEGMWGGADPLVRGLPKLNGKKHERWSSFRDEAKAMGYDGIVLKNMNDAPTLKRAKSDNVIVFDPSNIRSVNAAFDPDHAGSANLLHQGAVPIPSSEGLVAIRADELGFTTSAEKALFDPPPRFRDARNLTAVQWRKYFTEAGATKEAFEFMIDPALEALPKTGDISKADVIKAVRAQRPRAERLVEGENVDGSYFHELAGRSKPGPDQIDLRPKRESFYSEYVTLGPHTNYRQELIMLPEAAAGYKSHNWVSEGVIGHIRTTDRVTVEGAPVRFVDELQSDLHQEGAKFGYRGDVPRSTLEAAVRKARTRWHEHANEMGYSEKRRQFFEHDYRPMMDKHDDAKGWELLREYKSAQDKLENPRQPPRAPVKDWEKPFIRRVIQQAIADDKEVVAFTNHRSLNDSLQNEGTRKFYDERLPAHIRKVAKDLGAKVERVTVRGDKISAREQEILQSEIAQLQDQIELARTRNLGDGGEKLRNSLRRKKGQLKTAQDGGHDVLAIRITPEAKEKLAKGNVLFQGGRGQFDPDTNTISMFKSADPSTLMHEASHWYLDRLFKLRGNEFVEKQLDEILSWHGIKADEVFDEAGNITPRGKELQEAFAETFESYLQTGKAPVPRLQAIFDQFREWLTVLYKTLDTRQRSNLTPEIKETFDRMLAFEPEGIEKLNLEAMRNPQSVGAAAIAEPELKDYELANSLGSADVSAALRLNPLLRMATADSAATREIGAQLMENGMYLKRNLEGKASPVSVEQAMLEYRGWHAKAETAAEKAYKASRKDKSVPNMPQQEFYERVALAMRRGDQDANSHVVVAAKAYREAVEKVKDRAIQMGLLPEDVTVTTAQSYFHRMWNRTELKRRPTEFKNMVSTWLGETFDNMIARGSQLRFELEKIGAKPTDADKKFLAQVDELEEILEVEGNLYSYSRNVADDIFDALMGHDARLVDTGFSLVPGARGPLKERTFNIPDLFEAQGVRVEDFLVNDAQEVMSRYMRVMAADVELTRAFGSPSLEAPITRIREDYRKLVDATDKKGEKMRLINQMNNRIHDLNGVRDVIRGNYGKDTYDNMFARGAEMVRAWNFMTMLGGMTVSAFPDLGNKVMANGFLGIARDMIGPLVTDIKGVKGAAREAKELGIAVEMALATRIASLADVGDMYGRGSQFERFVNNLSNRFSNWTLMRHWNDVMKSADYIAATNRAVRVMERPARANKKAKAWLAQLGIGEEDYSRIMAQYKAHGEKRHTMRLAHVDKWTDEEAKRIWVGAMGKNANIQTVTPGAGDKLLVMNGDLGKTLGQFKSFAMAANQRVMIRGAQQARMGDARFISGITTFVALGMVVYALKSYLSNRGTSDDPVTWAREGVDRSGVLPVFMEVFNTAEKVSGQTFLGESPTSRYASRGKIDSMLGPSFGRMQNVSDVISNSLDGELKDRDLHAVRKLLPFNNIFYLRKILDEFEIQAVEALDAEETTLSDRRESMLEAR